jgi:hypothetical protein
VPSTLAMSTCWSNSSCRAGMWLMMPTIPPPTCRQWIASEATRSVSGGERAETLINEQAIEMHRTDHLVD